MAERKSLLAKRARELEEAVTRLFTGQGPAPKPKARRPARKKTRARSRKAKRTGKKTKARR